MSQKNRAVQPSLGSIDLATLINRPTQDENQFLDDFMLQKIFGKIIEDELDRDDPELDKPAYVLVEKRIDSKNVKRTLKPYAPYVCENCGFDLTDPNKYIGAGKVKLDLQNVTSEQLEQAKPYFSNLMKLHKQENHRGISPSKVITMREYLKSQKYGAAISNI